MSSGTITADGSTDAFTWQGGKGYFVAQGTYGGGTLTLEGSLDGTVWDALGDETTLTAGFGGIFECPPCELRATLSGASSPSLLYKAIKYDG